EMKTRKESTARRRAIASPIPRVPPVTIATRLAISKPRAVLYADRKAFVGNEISTELQRRALCNRSYVYERERSLYADEEVVLRRGLDAPHETPQTRIPRLPQLAFRRRCPHRKRLRRSGLALRYRRRRDLRQGNHHRAHPRERGGRGNRGRRG